MAGFRSIQGCSAASELLAAARAAITCAPTCKAELLAALVRQGLATTQPGTIRAGRRQMEVVWVMITDAGQRALADT